MEGRAADPRLQPKAEPRLARACVAPAVGVGRRAGAL